MKCFLLALLIANTGSMFGFYHRKKEEPKLPQLEELDQYEICSLKFVDDTKQFGKENYYLLVNAKGDFAHIRVYIHTKGNSRGQIGGTITPASGQKPLTNPEGWYEKLKTIYAARNPADQ